MDNLFGISSSRIAQLFTPVPGLPFGDHKDITFRIVWEDVHFPGRGCDGPDTGVGVEIGALTRSRPCEEYKRISATTKLRIPKLPTGIPMSSRLGGTDRQEGEGDDGLGQHIGQYIEDDGGEGGSRS